MEAPKGFLATLWNFICFLPYFFGLLLLGTIKGIVFCPLICLIITIGNSSIILGLLPFHGYWTCYSIVRTKLLGPFLKLFICVFLPVVLILWVVVGIVGSSIGGVLYGFLSPIFATFDAVGKGKTNDGTLSTISGSFTVVRDFYDVCFHSYVSLMEDLRQKGPPNGKYYEIRLLYLPPALIAAALGFIVDFPVISLIALCKSPYMLFKGWRRLFHDLIGREGPFLETICVPFAGLAILLWPLATVGAVLGSMVSSIFLGAYAGVIVYQESSFWFGICYIIASLSIYDEYSNDVLDMPEGSCFARPKYRQNLKEPISNAGSLSESDSLKPHPPARMDSLTNTRIDLKPLELLGGLFKECWRHGEKMVSERLITSKDIEEAKLTKGSRVIGIGLPAYCLLQTLLRSVNNNRSGILLSDNTEITATNRPKDTFFDWFLNPFLILKEQIKSENLSEEEEDYLGKLVLLCGDPERLKISNIGSPPESDRKRAELDAIARRLQGITKSLSRYPTFRRHFENLVNILSEDLAKKSNGGTQPIRRSKSALAMIFSNKSFNRNTSNMSDQELQSTIARDIEIA
ncbi:putative membrane protein [Gossypium australe]|uniref:Putative membrane protein n=1 Tax=Gossypium australe TaxID=47621 RepID=A0A5B6V4X7_9ROSI|nr:putative membrane protein [Gossypium australe]